MKCMIVAAGRERMGWLDVIPRSGKYLARCLSLLLLFTACKKETIDRGRIREFNIIAVHGGDYPIRVALPRGYAPDKRYPTLYVLDSQWDFEDVATACDKASDGTGRNDVLVVGIGWGNSRLDDYMPTPTSWGKGNADAFVRFIERALIPKMERDFQAQTGRESRGILGHSAGGLLVGHCFTNYNALFGNYICLSPSFWYDQAVALRNEEAHRAQNSRTKGNFFLALGGLEEKMRPGAERFSQVLSAYYPEYQSTYHIAAQQDHLDSKKPNIRRGINFYFQHR